jgi:hypothetical protein
MVMPFQAICSFCGNAYMEGDYRTGHCGCQREVELPSTKKVLDLNKPDFIHAKNIGFRNAKVMWQASTDLLIKTERLRQWLKIKPIAEHRIILAEIRELALGIQRMAEESDKLIRELQL